MMFPSVFIHSFAYSATILLTPGTCCVVPGTGYTSVNTRVAVWLAGEAEPLDEESHRLAERQLPISVRKEMVVRRINF